MPDSHSPASAQLSRRVLEVGLVGLLLFAVVGALEALVFIDQFEYPEPLLVLRQSVLWYAGLGLVLGTAWGMACEALCRRGSFDRSRLCVGPLAVILLTLVAAVHTNLRLTPPELPPTSLASLPWFAAELLLGAVLLAVAVLFSRTRDPSAGQRPLLRRPGTALGLAAGVLLLALLLPGAALRWQAGSPPDLPNVLLIVMDTTRVDRLSVYGYGRDTSPALARIASEGVVFTHAYSASPWTLPSHASIFTGVHPTVHGATSEHPRLADGPATLAERLHRRGLLTVAISKKSWLSDETGIFRGFDHTFDLFHRQGVPALLEVGRLIEHDHRGRPVDKGAIEVTAKAMEWLERNGDRPFFMFLNYNEPHNDLFPPAPFREEYLGDRSDTPWGRDEFPDLLRSDLGEISYTDEDLEIFSRLYDASLAYQDLYMGRLFEFLRRRGILDDTLLLVTADHGENLGEYGLLGHNLSMANTLLRVPLVIRYPARLPAGLVIDEPVENRRIDSLIQLVLSPPPSPGQLPGQLDERDRLDPVHRLDPFDRLGAHEIAGALSERPDRAVISEAYRPKLGRLDSDELPADPRFHRRRKSILQGDLKYVWSSDGADELYDLTRDPGELHNLVEERPEDRERLRALLAREEWLWQDVEQDEIPEFSDEMIDRLRAMGYLR